MSDTRSSMMATLADIRSKPETPARLSAAARIEAALGRMSDYAARAPKGGAPVRYMTPYDRMQLSKIIDEPGRGEEEKDRASRMLEKSEKLTEGDLTFLHRASGGSD